MVTRPRSATLGLLIAATVAVAPVSAQDWTETTSPNFRVFTAAGESRGRDVAHDLERIHKFFNEALPGAVSTPLRPVLVFAVADGDEFADLVPQYASGPRPGGLFQPRPFHNYIVLRIDAGRQLIYHEYFHLLTQLNLTGRLPLWLREGMAEFYSNADIDGRTATFGRPDPAALSFLQRRRLPLRTLLALTTNPHDGGGGSGDVSVFYAQAWALTHYLMMGRPELVERRALEGYVALVQQGVDQVDAFEQAVGDLDEYDDQLREYTRLFLFGALERPFDDDIDDKAFLTRTLTEAESLTRRASVRDRGGDPEGAMAMLAEAASLAPELALVPETRGLALLARGDRDGAARAVDQAVRLGSAGYAAHYLRAALSRSGDPDETRASRLTDLQEAMRLNPRFPPIHLALSRLHAEAQRYPQALAYARSGLDLDQTDAGAWLTLAYVFLSSGEIDAARTTIERARASVPDAEAAARLQPLMEAVEAVERDEARRREDGR